jgi:hypothetical protein
MVIAAAIDTAGVATAIGEAGTLLVALAVDMAEALGTAASAVGTALKSVPQALRPFSRTWLRGLCFAEERRVAPSPAVGLEPVPIRAPGVSVSIPDSLPATSNSGFPAVRVGEGEV